MITRRYADMIESPGPILKKFHMQFWNPTRHSAFVASSREMLLDTYPPCTTFNSRSHVTLLEVRKLLCTHAHRPDAIICGPDVLQRRNHHRQHHQHHRACPVEAGKYIKDFVYITTMSISLLQAPKRCNGVESTRASIMCVRSMQLA